MHCTNIFPLISPSAYAAARDENIPVVQSLHNFRSLCVNALLMRDERPCEACISRPLPLQGVRHRCYRDSYKASAVMAALIATTKHRRERDDPVAHYIALSEYSRQKHLEAGFDARRISVKPNFVYPDLGPGSGSGGHAMFVGRLSKEKGIEVLLEAWSRLREPIALKIAGDGPLAPLVEQAQRRDARIEWLGHRPVEEVCELVGDAACLVLPSTWYEVCPKSMLEAFSRGTPVIASRLGAMQEFIRHGETGWHFEAGNAAALAGCVQNVFADPAPGASLRPAVRREFEAKYTAEVNYERLMQVYASALDTKPGAQRVDSGVGRDDGGLANASNSN